MRYDSQRNPRRRSTRFDNSNVARRRKPSPLAWMRPLHLAAGVAAAVLALAALWYLGPTWRVREIVVSNNAGIPAEQIIGASGLQDEHYQFVDLAAAARRTDDLPGVDAAEVRCRWWLQATCNVTVMPARPLALWLSSSGYTWSDYEGKVQRTPEQIVARLQIKVEEGAAPELGADLDASLLRALTEFAVAEPALKSLSWSEKLGLAFEDVGGIRVRIGVADRPGAVSDKIRLARALADSLARRGVHPRMIDVRFQDAPYYSQ